jgi:predicted RNase H-like HicB family nuclease
MAEGLTDQNTYRVIYERDDNHRWFVRCPDVHGAHSHGRTLAAARANIREAIALVLELDDESGFNLAEEVRLSDPHLQQLLDRARKLRDTASQAEEEARRATVEAVAESTGSNTSLSVRDLADLLGLSHQRVQQLMTGVNQKA